MKTYACYNNNIEDRLMSSSGGLFILFSNYIINNGGVVYGVAMTDDCYSAEFRRIEKGDVVSLMGSKYFEAKIGDTYIQVKKDLLSNRKVLFTGTGCQIQGLVSFLQKRYDNLYTIDVICHGVPSPKLWKKYVEWQEERYGKLKEIYFRCKNESWANFGMRENDIYIPKDKDVFMRMFLSDCCLRPSCYECHSRNNKISDITFGDFWGVDNVVPELNDGKGTSLAIIRTNKGRQLFNNIKKHLTYKEVSYDESIKYNPAEFKSPERPFSRNTFYNNLDTITFDEMQKKYLNTAIPFYRKIIRKLKSILTNFLVSTRERESK